MTHGWNLYSEISIKMYYCYSISGVVHIPCCIQDIFYRN